MLGDDPILDPLSRLLETAGGTCVRGGSDPLGFAARTRLRGIVLTTQPGGPYDEALPAALVETLSALQDLVRHEAAAPLWLLSRGGSAREDAVDPAQRALWGLLAVAWVEHPELHGGVVDLPIGGDDSTILDQVVRAICTPDGEDLQAVGSAGTFVCRMERRDLPSARFRARDTALVTGALGGVGRHVCRWLARVGATRIVLAGRRGADHPDAQSAAAELRALGVTVEIIAADIAQPEDVSALLAAVDRSGPPLRAIFHLAAAIDDALLPNQNLERFQAAWNPKARGAALLDAGTRNRQLDAFVLFSSLGGVLGNFGIANYAAANAYLDGLAASRRRAGSAALAVDWGVWAGAGFGAKVAAAHGTIEETIGLRPLDPDAALAVLERALALDEHQLLVFDMDWGRAGRASSRPVKLLDGLLTPGESPDAAIAGLREAANDGAPDHAIGQRLVGYLVDRVAAVSRIPPRELGPDSNLRELGMDSLMMVQLRNRLGVELDTAVYANDLAAAPTIGALADLLLPSVRPWAARAPKGSASASGGVAATSRPSGSSGPAPARRRDSPTPPVFVLSAPRSGSTLLRVMLAGHPGLFSPPELHLLPGATLADRETFIAGSGMESGLVHAFMEAGDLNRPAAEALLERFRRDGVSPREIYLHLGAASRRRVIDKSPTSALRREWLDRSADWFPDALYLHLVRHPIAMIESFVRMRMHRLLAVDGRGDPWQVAEQVWRSCEENVEAFFASVPEDRKFRLRYEDLVTDPEGRLRGVCDWLGVPFEAAMLDPYGPDRMTEGVAGESTHVGDPNFARRRAIDPALADAWRTVTLPRPLSRGTVAIARSLGYDSAGEEPGARPAPPARGAAVQWTLPLGSLAGLTWGNGPGPAVLCVHGHREQGLVFEPVAAHLLREGRRVVAPDLRGHGLSPHLGGEGGYPLAALLKDLAALVEEMDQAPVLVGHSLGGMLALMLAAARPNLLRGLCLIDVPLQPPRTPSPTKQVEMILSAEAPEHRPLRDAGEAASRLCAAADDLPPELALSLATRLTEPSNGHFRWRWDPRLLLPLDGLALFGDPVELLTRVRSSGLPAGAVYGTRSPLTREEDVERLRAASFAVVRVDAGHHPHLSVPDRVAAAILDLDRR
jgi:pimeloyl-ACP methyl ester carboxylesterase/NAD(P)-dependent dehydrogenase (short-subunit alcohol dehydrogenase family)/aryl carrier-like protein